MLRPVYLLSNGKYALADYLAPTLPSVHYGTHSARREVKASGNLGLGYAVFLQFLLYPERLSSPQINTQRRY